MTLVAPAPLHEFNDRVAAYLQIHRNHATQPYIGNVRSTVDALEAGGVRFPVTINDAEPDNAWVCSPLTTYSSYAREEIVRLGHPWLTAPLRAWVTAMGGTLRRARIDRAVAINNWLLSTNIYPDLADVDLDRVLETARDRWPTHALWFRSLNVTQHADWLGALARRGCILVPSRQVYLFDDIARLARRHADLKRDLGLLDRAERAGRLVQAFGEEDYERVAQLYAALYVGKYSASNPVYSARFIRAWHAAGLLDLAGVRDEQGSLAGVVGIVRIGRLLTSPIVGYDTSQPRSAGLYRMLAAMVMRQAITQGCAVNLSAGVAHFKRQRGGQPAIEYSAVLASHLPARTRSAIAGLGAVTRLVGVPVMRRFRL